MTARGNSSAWRVVTCCLIGGALMSNDARGISGEDNSLSPAYTGGWADGSNGGTGFGPWKLVSESTAIGFAGFFMPGSAGSGVDNAGQPTAQDGSAWASYANKGDGIDRATAYRGFSTPLNGPGDEFTVTLENGFVNGLAGVALRTGNANTTAADFATDARLQVYFRGAEQNYVIADGEGEFDTGVPHSFFGIKTNVRLTGANTYDIDIIRYDEPNDATPTVTTLAGRTLAGSGSIESLALHQQDSETQSDAFFNKLAYTTSAGSGADDASDFEYSFGWDFGVNGGFGFGPWEMATETDGGFAGQYIQSNPGNGVDNIGTSGGAPVTPDGTVWASYANKGNFADKSIQYRDFSNPLAAAGDTFAVSFEHGFIDPTGKVGVSLRDRAVNSFEETVDNFADEALFQFYFEGGDNTYTLVDASGEIDTGVGFSFWGIDLDLTLTSATTFDLAITRYGTADDPAPEVTTLTGLTFADTLGDGTIESLAFVNIDAPTQSDVYFNNLGYTAVEGTAGDFDGDGDVDGRDFLVWQRDPGVGNLSDWQANYGNGNLVAAVGAIPEPATIMLLAAASGLYFLRRR